MKLNVVRIRSEGKTIKIPKGLGDPKGKPAEFEPHPDEEKRLREYAGHASPAEVIEDMRQVIEEIKNDKRHPLDGPGGGLLRDQFAREDEMIRRMKK